MTSSTPLEISELRVLEVLGNPLRLRLLHHLSSRPCTVRDLAETLGVPNTRLYYHLDLLESCGIIEVAETRKSGARVQRVYRAVATSFKIGSELVERVEDKRQLAEATVGTVLDGARLDAVSGLVSHFEFMEGRRADEVPGTVFRTVSLLSRDAAREIAERLTSLIEEMNEREETDQEPYALSVVFFPMVAPVKGESL